MKKWLRILLPTAAAALVLMLVMPRDNGGTDNVNYEDNALPVVYLTIDEEEFRQVNESEDHSYRAPGASIRIAVPQGYVSAYSEEALTDTEEMSLEYFRGRGHGTWSADKKPYRFKLDASADLLGMGSSKHWVLLANRYDETLLRNRLISYIGTSLGMPYTPKSVPVSLVVNGEYWGSYVLSEQVRIGKSRIAIDELKETDLQEPEITGGYLISLEPGYDEPLENTFLTDRMVSFNCDEPEFTEGESGQMQQKDYLVSYIQKTEDALYGEGMTDEEGISYHEYMDIRSAADYWWMQEYSGNFDAFTTTSTYLYKERSGKLYWGPLWDFDLSLGGGLDSTEGFGNTGMVWLDRMRAHDPAYQEILRERWQVLNEILIRVTEKDGILDQYAAEIERSWQDDQARWPLIDDEGNTFVIDFHEAVENMRSWMENRRIWINEHIDDELTYVYDTVSFLADDEIIEQEEVLHDSFLSVFPPGPFREGYVFAGWENEEGLLNEQEKITHDMQLKAVYIPVEEAIPASALCYAQPYDVYADLHIGELVRPYVILPPEAQEIGIVWSSSDPDVAEIDRYGNVILRHTGTAVITGTLHSGIANSYTLHVYDSLQESLQAPTELNIAEKEIILDAGQYEQISMELLPQPGNAEILFETDNADIAEVDYYGIIHAISPGTAEIRITAGEMSDTVTVTVR